MPDDPTDADPTVELLVEEFARRWRAGDRPSVTEYEIKYPALADEIRDVFPAVRLMEELKPRREDATPLSRPTGPVAAPERVGEFRIVRELGRGGMGVVYEAVQESLNRRVALKVLPAHLFAQDHLRARFVREAHAAAKLHHTNIVPVFAVGEHAGTCFYVMQLIPGRSLDRLVVSGTGSTSLMDLEDVPEMAATPAVPADAGGPLSPADIARVGVQVADALAYAHSQGVLHRDIKPSNLLLDDRGAAWVTDFGVAKLVQEANLTQSGDLIGTLRYMPPERFAGRSDAGGDVYALGVTLYELLAGRSAFPNTTPQHLIHLITHTDLPPLALAHVPRDLETIVLKAAAREAPRRYPSAAALADDLRRFLDDRPILARRMGPLERARRWCARNPLVAGSMAAVFLLLGTVAGVSVVAYVRTANARAETADANAKLGDALSEQTRQREQAERTSALALGALNRLYDRFAPTRLVATPPATTADGVELPAQPLLPPEAVPLLEEMLLTYERIARASGEFDGLRPQAAEANQRIGEIRQRLGRFESAAAAYRTAIDLYASLPADDVRIPLARSYNELGRALRALQRPAEAGQAVTRAVETLTAAPPAFAARPECRYELARAYYTLGQRDFLSGPGLRGGPGFKGPKKDWEPKGNGPPPPKDWPGGGFGGLKRGWGPKGDDLPPVPAAAGHPGQKAIALLKQLRAEYPKVPEYRHLLACCFRDVPPSETEPKDEAPRPELAIALLRELVRDFPQVPDYKFDLCETLRMRPPFARPDEARARIQEAVDLSAELIAQYPNVPQYPAAQAQALDRLAAEQERAGDRADAETTRRKAVLVQTVLATRYPDVSAYGVWLGVLEFALARAVEGRNGVEARALYESAVARLEKWRAKDPAAPAVRLPLALAYRDLARVYARAGEPAQAARAAEQAAALGPPPGGKRP